MAAETLSVEARLIDNVTRTMKGIGKSTLKTFNRMSKSARGFAASMKSVGGSLLSIKGLILGAGLAKAFSTTVGAAAKFESQMASVATLSQEMTDNIGKFSKEVLDLATVSGQSLDTLTTSLFDSISAGIGAGDAMEFLTIATKLAIGGATETSVAVDGLTTVINAFGLEAKDASDVSDAFFTAMKFGKTTIAELATTLGPLAPTARAAGIGFDEMLGAVSALTKAGFPTARAITAMQGALVAINSLTPEVTKKLQGLGFATKVTGKEGETFIDILKNISKAGGGTLEGVKALIPNIEGVKGILALTVEDGKNFAEVMRLMGERAGETAKAYSKFTDTFEFKSNRVKQSFNVAFIEIGNQIIPAMSNLADNILANMDSIKKGMAFASAFIADAWNGLVFLFKTASGTIRGSFNFILTGLSELVNGAFKLINLLPGTLVPESWIKAMDDFSNITLQDTKNAFKDVANAATELEGSQLEKIWLGNSIAIQAAATSVKDLTQVEKELVGIATKAAEQEATLSQTKVDERTAFLENIKQLELDFQARTHEGRVAQLETERSELLAMAQEFKQSETAINLEFDARVLKEKKTQAKNLVTIQKKLTEESEKESDKRIAKLKEEADRIIALRMAWASSAVSILGTLGQVSAAFGASEKTQKKIAFASAIIQGALAVQKAVASAPPPANIPAIIATTAKTAANVAIIASQAFRTGGLPVGRNANVRLNEAGQEAVLNAGATVRMGTGQINRLNAGRSTNNTVTNQISYSPTFTIGQDANEDFIDTLKRDKESFANFIQEELIDRGFLNISMV